jgi:hypothetical protein
VVLQVDDLEPPCLLSTGSHDLLSHRVENQKTSSIVTLWKSSRLNSISQPA